MATGFELAYDLVHLHREYRRDPATGKVSRGVPAEIGCLGPGAFLAAFAHGEKRLTASSKERGLRLPPGPPRHGAPFTLTDTDLIDAYRTAGIELVARARVAPRGATNIWKWKLLEGQDLSDYLSDATAVRNRIAHTGSPDGATVNSTWFRLADGHQAPVTLMAVEGVLQAVQDVCYIAATRAQLDTLTWHLPERTATGTMPKQLRIDRRFPLPSCPAADSH